jgi:protease I
MIVTSAPVSTEVNEMANVRLDGLRVAVLLGDNFEQVEMTEPRKALDAAGAHTTLISPAQGQIRGVAHDRDLQGTFPVELPLEPATPDDFDALLLPGGALNADSMRILPNVQKFVRKVEQAAKPMAVICHAPWLLVSAGLVKGRTLTSYPTLQDEIRNAGGTWLDIEVVRDGESGDEPTAERRPSVQLGAAGAVRGVSRARTSAARRLIQ